MKILSWNVNGLRARLDAINRIVTEIKPDIMCFQKTRSPGSFIVTIPGFMGWGGIVGDTSGLLYGGVSSFTNKNVPINFKAQNIQIPDWLLATGCINVINVEQFILINVYVPYSDIANEEYVKIRQRWDYEFHEFVTVLSKRKPVIICGDMNIVSADIDAWDGVSIKQQGCFLDWEHRNFNALLRDANLVDSYRELYPTGTDFSYFFQNKPEYRLGNHGFRIDYFLISETLLPYVDNVSTLTDFIDTTNNPILLELTLPKRL